MRSIKPLLLPAALIVATIVWSGPGAANSVPATAVSSTTIAIPGFLRPKKVRTTLDRSASGGPLTYRQDGVVFGNDENLLQRQPRGYHREYTVETCGADTLAARRIITGGTPPDIYYRTDYYCGNDRYRRFRAFRASR